MASSIDLNSGHSVATIAASAPDNAALALAASVTNVLNSIGQVVNRRIEGAHAGAEAGKLAAQFDRGGTSQRIGPRLIGEAEHGHGPAGEAAESLHDAPHRPMLVCFVAWHHAAEKRQLQAPLGRRSY